MLRQIYLLNCLELTKQIHLQHPKNKYNIYCDMMAAIYSALLFEDSEFILVAVDCVELLL